MDAAYVFGVRFRLVPEEGVRVAPRSFETTMERRAAPPGESGWLFFRDALWRGEANDDAHHRSLAESALGVPVESVEFRELRTDRAYLDALDEAIAAELDAGNGTFGNAENVERVKTNYLGSSIHVRSSEP
ncbi:LWR-salt protein [Halomarina oriensis]|uniref:LWR-salt protein n=1 Tax=Halomarina oriensis TaxID=671145 RepID=A0A6B0GGV0_9EURY|nr:LWR-salt protein [Halomarina oriensis]MWG34136.1 LWR-salt protein [Halomarina oriensis]